MTNGQLEMLRNIERELHWAADHPDTIDLARTDLKLVRLLKVLDHQRV